VTESETRGPASISSSGSKEPLGDYLRRFVERQGELLRHGMSLLDYPILVAASLSLEGVARESEAASRLILACSFLAPMPLPLWVIQEGKSHWLKDLEEKVSAAEVLELLARYGLIAPPEAGLGFPHPLIAVAARQRLSRAAQGAALELALFLLASAFRSDLVNKRWPKLQPLLPHLEAVLSHAKALQATPVFAPFARMIAASALLKGGHPEAAAPILLGALPLSVEVDPELPAALLRHLEKLSMSNLGRVEDDAAKRMSAPRKPARTSAPLERKALPSRDAVPKSRSRFCHVPGPSPKEAIGGRRSRDAN
jgi:hypothetical protein